MAIFRITEMEYITKNSKLYYLNLYVQAPAPIRPTSTHQARYFQEAICIYGKILHQ